MVDAAALPRGRRRGGAADRARGAAASSRSPRCDDAARRAAGGDAARLAGRRRAHARGRSPSSRASRLCDGSPACHPRWMVDWNLAAKVAEGVAALQPRGDAEPFQALVRPADEAERARLRVHRAHAAAGALPVAEAVEPRRVDRGEPRARCAACSTPAAERRRQARGPLGGVVGGAAGALLGVEAGAISASSPGACSASTSSPCSTRRRRRGCCSSRRTSATRPTTLDADPDQLLRWVALHEITHALQFGGVPWLRPHLAGLVRELTARSTSIPGSAAQRAARASTTCAGLVDTVREGGIAARRCSARSSATLLDRVQATMAVLEGYAEHVMDAVGADVIADLADAARGAGAAAARDRTGLLRLLEKLIGMDMKMRQYERGKRSATTSSSRRASTGSTACGRGPSCCRRWPSSTIPPAGSSAPRPPPPEPLDRRSERVPPAGRNRSPPCRRTLLPRGRTDVPFVTKLGIRLPRVHEGSGSCVHLRVTSSVGRSTNMCSARMGEAS